MHVSDRARKDIAMKNNFCRFCFLQSTVPHLPKDKKCKSNENCFGWFSTEHHKLFCVERIKAFKVFIPKIDHNLLQRFVDTFDPDEKYTFVLTSPSHSNIITLDYINVMSSFNSDKFNGFSASPIVLVNTYMKLIRTDSEKEQKLCSSINAKTLICLPKVLHIDFTKLPGNVILQMLSHHTKDFRLYDSHNSNSQISFSDIIKKAPNLQKITIFWTTIVIFENSWLKDLMKFKIGKNIKQLRVILDAIELNVEDLVEVVKNRCIEIIEIDIRFNKNKMQ
uniref:Uncharacterized protein n=1 Tax=Panagrolaimus sp. PS1159 TaxID=55785 RepID=A0AC35G5H9_9BILA